MMDVPCARCAGRPLATFEQYGRLNNNLQQLVNMLWWAHLANATLVVPPFLHERLRVFDLHSFYCGFCARPPRQQQLRTVPSIPAVVAYLWPRPLPSNRDELARFGIHYDVRYLNRAYASLTNATAYSAHVTAADRERFTRRVFAHLFAAPRAPLVHTIGCALAALRAASQQLASDVPAGEARGEELGAERRSISAVGHFAGRDAGRWIWPNCTAPEPFRLQQPVHLPFAAVHVRALEGDCERQHKRHAAGDYSSSPPAYCTMSPAFVAAQLRSRGCGGGTPLYVATDWQKPAHVHALLRSPELNAAVMHTPPRKWQAASEAEVALLWADLALLALATCRVLNPVSTFGLTVEELRRAWRLM